MEVVLDVVEDVVEKEDAVAKKDENEENHANGAENNAVVLAVAWSAK